MLRKANQPNGFTLLELITTMVILGLIGAIGAIGFGDAIRGYSMAQNSAELAQKAQVALTRFNVELMQMNATSASTATSITYTPVFELPAPTLTQHTFAYDAGNDVVTWDGNVLVDDVAAFSIEYFDNQSGTSDTTFDPVNTDIIQINLGLTNAINETETFVQRIYPLVYKVARR